jgi:dual specificity MAP kinase phosphatase
MAYMMQHRKMGLMDAYLITRARRLNGEFCRYTKQPVPWRVPPDVLFSDPFLSDHFVVFAAVTPYHACSHPVLIQPNLRFFHELFGWEIELLRQEESELERRCQEARSAGMEEAVQFLQAEEKRRILYTWPAFCRDLVSDVTALSDIGLTDTAVFADR